MSSGTDDAGNFGPFTTEQYKAMYAKIGINKAVVKQALLAEGCERGSR
jgi:hypothetical protein